MPFIQTALVNNDDENILHFGAFKIRVVGEGNLDSQFIDMDSVTNQSLNPIAMALATEDEPVVLANFITQRAMLKLSTDQFDEIMNVTRIIIYMKELWKDDPR